MRCFHLQPHGQSFGTRPRVLHKLRSMFSYYSDSAAFKLLAAQDSIVRNSLSRNDRCFAVEAALNWGT